MTIVLTPDDWWLVAQGVVMIVVAVLYARLALRAYLIRRNRNDDPLIDASSVVATALFFVSVGNVVTSWSLAAHLPDAVNVGGLLIRGALFTLAVYLTVAAPLTRSTLSR